MVESGVSKSGSTLIEEMKILEEFQSKSNARKGSISSELWHACAGPLVTLPQPGSLVYYFPQGHSEQVTASTRRMVNTHIPSYPNLLSQMMCQVHNVTLHADKETDEIYAQMILQPVNSENDVLPIPNFGLTKSRQPGEFFCKTLTASDTSTHGGFSVPRRAAEKLFPPLDYTMQPPNQELVVKDLHDNTWTFRHIYRGQPKRHLLTTGWSVFVGSKRLKAGDSVLFIRGDKSQLLLGIRRANRQQMMPPSSVLSADSMHIGVLAAAAHAAANRSQFTVYYNPRACPSEFVVPLEKYHKAAYGTQVSVGMRFGMMFETEDSNKRRYTGIISGINDFDPLRWPNSKWRNLQVEWDENGCTEMPDRVSLWEIETPDNLFMFPSQSSSSSSLKRPYVGLMGVESNTFMKTLHEPSYLMQNTPAGYQQSLYLSLLQSLMKNGQPLRSLAASECNETVNLKKQETVYQGQEKQIHDPWTWRSPENHASLTSDLVSQSELSHEDASDGSQSALTEQSRNELGQTNSISSSIMEHGITRKHDGRSFLGTIVGIPGQTDQFSQIKLPNSEQQLPGEHTAHDLVQKIDDSISVYPKNPDSQSLGDKVSSLTTDGAFQHVQYQQFDANLVQPGFLDGLGWMLQYPSSYMPCIPELKPLDSFNSDELDNIDHSASVSGIHENEECNKRDQSMPISSEHSLGHYPPLLAQEFLSCQFTDDLRDVPLQGAQHSHGLKCLADDSRNPTDIYSSFDFDESKVSTLIDPFVSSTGEELGTIWDGSLTFPSNMAHNLNSCQDVQSQITSGSYTEFSVQEFPDNSRNAPGNADLCDNSLINAGSWKLVPPLRTYTKVQKVGSVGRSIDVTRFRDYKELKSTIASMFGLEGQLDDPIGSGWKLVYMDYENDVLLVGDDPWEEFISCVRCIRILSPSEVQQMSHKDPYLNNNPSSCHGE